MRVRRAEPGDFGSVTALLEELGRAKVTAQTREAVRQVFEAQLAEPEAGPLVVEEAERRARERGCWALTLESGYAREEAHVLYEAFGMTNEGYYFGKPLN